MNRRNFIKSTLPLGMLPFVFNGIPLRSFAAAAPLVVDPCAVTDRSMVIIFLNGGNDIVNTTVPLNHLASYALYRPNIHLPESSLITLDSSLPPNQQLGLHPQLTGFKSLYDDGLMSIVQGVGYEEPNRSHFTSLQNWLTGSGGPLVNEDTGWLARFLGHRYPGYNGNPFVDESDPLAVLFGDMNNRGFYTNQPFKWELNLSGQDPAGFYSLVSSMSGDPILNIPITENGEMLTHIAEIENSVNIYAQRISETYYVGSNSTVLYPDNTLANQLKSIARMLSGGSRTKIFMATMGGFDNHSYEVSSGDSTVGNHANLMERIGGAIKAFQDDLENLSLDSNVITVVFSEFGRKIIQNANYGTDHGTLSSVFVVGKGVQGGVIGNNLDLDDQDTQGAANPLALQHDYRQIFATLMQDWFGADDNSLADTFISPSFYATKLPLINSTHIVPGSCLYVPVIPVVSANINVKIMLEGFYVESSANMHTDLLTSLLIPLSNPYTVAPFNYTGTETITTYPAGTVDWILIELRPVSNLGEVTARKAMLLRNDGIIMDVDGNPGINFQNVPDMEYHIAIFHRNHLAVISSEAVFINAPGVIYDFTQSDDRAYGTEQLKQIGSDYVMIAGDIDNNQVINSLDFNLYQSNEGANSVYNNADLNADGNVDNQDLNLWLNNRSKLGQLK